MSWHLPVRLTGIDKERRSLPKHSSNQEGKEGTGLTERNHGLKTWVSSSSVSGPDYSKRLCLRETGALWRKGEILSLRLHSVTLKKTLRRPLFFFLNIKNLLLRNLHAQCGA